MTQFILPGGDHAAAHCHVARTICRRAERCIVEFSEYGTVHPEIVQYINRLSDLLFVPALKLSANSGIPEIHWKQS